jgi:hypothetical protein
MNRIRPDLDIIADLLKESLACYPNSRFLQSLQFQYQERGSLSKKQLEGLYNKAASVNAIAPAKLATLQAIILKKHSRHRSELPVAAPGINKADELDKMSLEILAKYPQHKAVLFIRSKFGNNEAVTPTERSEIERLHKLLLKK